MPGPAEAVKLLSFYIHIQAQPQPLLAVLQNIIRSRNWHTPHETPEEIAERWERSFKIRIEEEIKKLKENGGLSLYEISHVNEWYIQGSCFVEPKDDPHTAAEKIKRANTPMYINQFKNLTPVDFEKLSGKYLIFLMLKKNS